MWGYPGQKLFLFKGGQEFAQPRMERGSPSLTGINLVIRAIHAMQLWFATQPAVHSDTRSARHALASRKAFDG